MGFDVSFSEKAFPTGNEGDAKTYDDDDILTGDELIEQVNEFYHELRKLGIDSERFWLQNLDPFKPRRKSELREILRRLKGERPDVK